MSSSLPIAIIGNGGAAVRAVKALRNSGYQKDIHLFSDSMHAAYNPMLTTYFIGGKIPLEQCFPFSFGFEFYKRHGVELHLGSPIVELNATTQTIRSANGGTLCYGKCLVATGASPFVPPIPGKDLRRVYTLRTIEDALRLKKIISQGPRKALVVGASMVGIKLVELFLNAGIEVCFADLAKQIFPVAADDGCARLIENQLVQHGVKLRLGEAISAIEETSNGVRAHFSEKEPPEEADFVVLSIGIKPNTGFLDSAQVEIDTGVIVDERMRTSAENLYAAGDTAQSLNLLTGKKEVIALWSNAQYHGRTAGRNMAGGSDSFQGSLPHNITHFMDTVLVCIGDPKSEGEPEMACEYDESLYRCTVRQGGKLKSVNLLNSITCAGTLKYLFTRQCATGSHIGTTTTPLSMFQEKLVTNQCSLP
jgi:NAD(P)H-nitrite reductase large subunit